MIRRRFLASIGIISVGIAGCTSLNEESTPNTDAEDGSSTGTQTETPSETPTETSTGAADCDEGGYVEVNHESEVPTDMTPVEFEDASVEEIDEVVDAFESALESGSGSARVDSDDKIDEIYDQLPEEAYDDSGGLGGYYIDYDEKYYQIQIIHYVGC